MLGLITKIVAYLLILLCATWTYFALWYFDNWPRIIRIIGAMIWLSSVIYLVIGFDYKMALLVVLLCTGIMIGLWSFRQPSNHLNWSKDQEKLPTATIRENLVTISKIRHAVYQSADQYNITWYTKTYDLEKIKSVDFIIEPFSSWRGLAHTFLSFGFEGDDYISISIEIRKQTNETYSPLKGLFRQYELMYVIADERDAIGLRANIRKNPVHVYPIHTPVEKVRDLFVDMVKRANQLAKQPEFYNTITNNCGINIVRHMDRLRKRPLSFDFRILFPGYADELAKELGLIQAQGTIEEIRSQYLINPFSAFERPDENWSLKIRPYLQTESD